MSLLDWSAEQLRRVRERLSPLSKPKHSEITTELGPPAGEIRVPDGVLLSQIHHEIVGRGGRRSERWPDKVRGFKWATIAHERAVREGRFDDARRHGRALAHLTDDLRGGR